MARAAWPCQVPTQPEVKSPAPLSPGCLRTLLPCVVPFTVLVPAGLLLVFVMNWTIAAVFCSLVLLTSPPIAIWRVGPYAGAGAGAGAGLGCCQRFNESGLDI